MLVLKVLRGPGGLIRRTRLPDAPSSFADLVNHIQALFPDAAAPVRITWVDEEGDAIIIANNRDVVEAVTAGAAGHSLRLTLWENCAPDAPGAVGFPSAAPPPPPVPAESITVPSPVDASPAPSPPPPEPSVLESALPSPPVYVPEVPGLSGRLDTDCSVVFRLLGGQPCPRTWHFVNNGTEAWPAGTRLAHVGADLLNAPAPFVAACSAPVLPGAGVDIRVDFVAPLTPGRYSTFWRLVTDGGVRFGDRAWLSVSVLTEMGDEEVRVEDYVVVEAPPEPYAPQLGELSAMGFTDASRCLTALHACAGDLNAAVLRLLDV